MDDFSERIFFIVHIGNQSSAVLPVSLWTDLSTRVTEKTQDKLKRTVFHTAAEYGTGNVGLRDKYKDRPE
jgi:hypothetical protein